MRGEVGRYFDADRCAQFRLAQRERFHAAMGDATLRSLKLASVDLIADYWAGEAIAHTIVSFGFSDGQYLAWSIELRRVKDQAWSALAGFFKESELITLAGDERDLIRLRTNVGVRKFAPFTASTPIPTLARKALLAYVAEANEADGGAALVQYRDDQLHDSRLQDRKDRRARLSRSIGGCSSPVISPTMPMTITHSTRACRSRNCANSPKSPCAPKRRTRRRRRNFHGRYGWACRGSRRGARALVQPPLRNTPVKINGNGLIDLARWSFIPRTAPPPSPASREARRRSRSSI